MILGTHKKTNATNKNIGDIILDNTKLERVRYTQFLGVLIDENLTWKVHIDSIQNNIKKYI